MGANEIVEATSYELATGGYTVADVVDLFIEELDASEKTKATYRRALRQYDAWLRAEGVDLDRTGKVDVMRWRDHLKDGKSPETVNSYLHAVKALYRWLHERTGYPDAAATVRGVKVGNTSTKEALPLSVARDILAAPAEGESGLRDAAMISLMLRRGLRTVEVVRADVGDLRARNGVMVLWVQGKGHEAKDDYVVLGDQCERAIRSYLKERGEVPSDAPLFASTANRNRGGRMTTRSVSRVAKNAIRAQGIDSAHVTAHSLRHSAVTFSLMGGASVREAQTMARHASITTTERYAHEIDKLSDPAGSAIDELLG